jgi:hypothetical protein
VKPERKSPRQKGQEEREHHDKQTLPVEALTDAANSVAKQAMKLGHTLGQAEAEAREQDQRTRITVVTMDFYGPSPLEGLMPLLKALETLRG